MASEIPFINAPDFQFEIALDGTVYLMRLRWNHYAEAWYMDLLTRARTPLVFGTKLTAKRPLLAEQAGDLIPKGEFYVYGEPYSFEAFTKAEAQLIYYSEDEMNAF